MALSFDALNRLTRLENERKVDRFNPSAPNSYRANFNRLNNETYKAHNGAYPDRRY